MNKHPLEDTRRVIGHQTARQSVKAQCVERMMGERRWHPPTGSSDAGALAAAGGGLEGGSAADSSTSVLASVKVSGESSEFSPGIDVSMAILGKAGPSESVLRTGILARSCPPKSSETPPP